MKAESAAKSRNAGVIKNLEEGLNRGGAHASFEDAVKNVSHALLGSVPEGLPYSIWQLVEHIRITHMSPFLMAMGSRFSGRRC